MSKANYEQKLATAKSWLKGETVRREGSHFCLDKPIQKGPAVKLDADQFWALHYAATEAEYIRRQRPRWTLNPIGDVEVIG